MELDSGRERPRLRPRRPMGIEALEVYDRRGDGHTVSRHCGTNPVEEEARLERHPALPATGSFPDVPTAQRSVEACVAAHRDEVEQWRRGPRIRLAIDHDMGEVIGDVLRRGGGVAGDPAPQSATGVRVVLRRNRSYRAGFAVLTAYPILHATTAYRRRQ